MGREYPDAIDMFISDPTRVFTGAMPRGAIVIHKTASNRVGETAEDTARYFATTPLKTSSHFVIGRDGHVVQVVSLSDGAAANCCLNGQYDLYWDQYGLVNLNTVTISIEHVDETQGNNQPCTSLQLAASFKLCKWLKDNMNMQTPDVKTHASIDPVNKARCPGNYPMGQLIAFMDATQGNVPQGWTDDGQRLHNPTNNFVVASGFRSLLLGRNDWSHDNVPLEDEHGSSPVDLSDPKSGTGTSQLFRYAKLGWTSKSGTYETPVGAELLHVMSKH